MRAYKECPHINNRTRRAYHQRRQIFQLLGKEHCANHVENALRNGVGIMLTRDDVLRQEGETECARQNTGAVMKNVVNKFV